MISVHYRSSLLASAASSTNDVILGGWGGAVVNAKHVAQTQILDMLQTWQSDL